MKESVILIVDDLSILPALESTLSGLGYQALVATNETTVTRALFKSPVLAIIDLVSHSVDWKALAAIIKKSKAGPVPVIAFAPQVTSELHEKALATGCDILVGRDALTTRLPHLLEKHKWRLDRSRCRDQPPLLVREGIELFNRGEYFECHEAIEHAWIDEKSPIRIMYQGILQIGVACYHIQNSNWRGAMKLLERGIPKTERFAPQCMGINLAQLLTDAQAVRQELIRLGPQWHGEFNPDLLPSIHLEASTMGDVQP